MLASLPDELRRLWHYLFFHPLWFLPEKAKWIMTGLRFPREMAIFATHDFKLVPSTLWWLMACDPPWFMASRRHYFLGCKSWAACFPHQLLTVIVSASSTLSGMLAVKEGNGEMGERIKEKAWSSTDLLLTQAWHLRASLSLSKSSFSSSWSSLSLSLSSDSLRLLREWCGKWKPFSDSF